MDKAPRAEIRVAIQGDEYVAYCPGVEGSRASSARSDSDAVNKCIALVREYCKAHDGKPVPWLDDYKPATKDEAVHWLSGVRPHNTIKPPATKGTENNNRKEVNHGGD